MKVPLAVLAPALAALALGACSSPTVPVDIDDRVSIPPLSALDFAGVRPSGHPDYWELRWTGAAKMDSIVGSGGPLARGELPGALRESLDLIGATVETGFALACMPIHCFKFVASVAGNAVEARTTIEDLRQFLGAVESLAEAAILLDAHAFFWDDGVNTGWRPVRDGMEFVVFEVVSYCVPVQTDRVRLVVSRNGGIEVRAREMWERLEGACV